MLKNKDYFPYDFYALRMPSQPIEAILALNKKIERIDINNYDEVINVLDELFYNELFYEAIYVSSKELYATYQNFRKSKKEDIDKAKRFLISFYKYFSRMSHRSTPYGLFSGITCGNIANQKTNIEFSIQKYNPVFQFNIQTIAGLVKKLENSEFNLNNLIKFYVNDTLYKLGNKIYYVEKIEKGYFLASNLTSITSNAYIEKVIEKAKDGAVIGDLIKLIDIPNVTQEQVVSFVFSLIKSQILVSEFWVSTSSDDFINDLLKKMRNKNIDLEEINEIENTYKNFKTVKSINDIKHIRDYLNSLPSESVSSSKDSFKVDLFYNTKENTINKDATDKIIEQSYELMLTTDNITSESLNNFKDEFFEKYEQREVPLMLALDPNHGVGYGYGNAAYTPLVSDVPVEGPTSNNYSLSSEMEIISKNVFKRMLVSNEKVVNIEKDIQHWIKEKKSNFENRTKTSVYIFGSLLASSQEDLDNGKFKFKPVQLHAPYTSRLLSRFLHGDPKMKQKIQELAKEEQQVNSDAILAEVIHLPDGKFANISLYPNLRNYEITYCSASNLPKNHQININDLMVSIKRNRVVLRSVKLNKEVIPIVSNTYDSNFGDPIYQFLSAVSYQNMNHGFHWNWSTIYTNEPFLPRIEYKNLILSRARWYITKSKINYKNEEEVKVFIDLLREKYSLPKLFIIPEGDNELLIDLDNKICRYLLAKQVNEKNLAVYEFLKTPENCFIKHNNQSFTNEILLPIGTDKPMYSKFFSNHDFNVENTTQRVFSPGSDWLYLKIYTGTKIQESILTQIIGSFGEELKNKGVIDKWFFIRYADPKSHIRVRFHKSKGCSDIQMWYQILENLQRKINQFVQEDHAVKIIVDSYQREIERYGENTIEESETIFWADSVAIYKFLSLIYGDEGEELRWKFGLVSVDKLLNDFGYNLNNKLRLMKNISEYFYNEFNQYNSDGGKFMSRVIKDKFRNKRKEIESFLMHQDQNSDFKEAYDCFEERSNTITEEVNIINHTKMSNDFRDDFVASHIHMTMNRLFLVNQRKHELVIYYFLSKFYESLVARTKQKKEQYAI